MQGFIPVFLELLGCSLLSGLIIGYRRFYGILAISAILIFTVAKTSQSSQAHILPELAAVIFAIHLFSISIWVGCLIVSIKYDISKIISISIGTTTMSGGFFYWVDLRNFSIITDWGL